MATRLTEEDWLKLNGFAERIAGQIEMKLPSDWRLTFEEIRGAVYDEFIKLLAGYKDGAMSPTTYCFQWAEKKTFDTLMREYARMKAQVEIDEYGEEAPTSRAEEVADPDSDFRRDLEIKELLDAAESQMDAEERRMARDYAEGATFAEIGEKAGVTGRAVEKRLRREQR